MSKETRSAENEIHSFLLERFIHSLNEKELQILENIPVPLAQERVKLLITRRLGEGELDIFCIWHNDGKTMKAIFLTLHPSIPMMALTEEELRARIKNLKRQKFPYEQSLLALTSLTILRSSN